MFQRYGKRIMWIGLALLIIFLIIAIANLFARPTVTSSQNTTVTILFIGIAIGLAFMYLIWRVKKVEKSARSIVTENSNTIVESMKKVFKIVCAEGYISEVYNYKESTKLLAFIPAYKSALVIVKAKVLIGYDIEKCKWEIDETTQKVRLLHIPEPEILSVESDYNYYSLDDEIFYKFSNEDFRRIQENAKKQVQSAALQSDLPKIAKEQLKTLLTEVIQSKQWKLEDEQKLLN
jgi:preprotein translocase subunit YajC